MRRSHTLQILPNHHGGETVKLESDFKAQLREDLADLFPGCYLFKQDANALPGVPDMLIIHEGWWAMLETKRSLKERSNPRPNQEWYVDEFNRMSFAAFIYPENYEEVLNGLQRSFESYRDARVSQR